jgi:undecaprenyl-diphosphatase
MKRLERPDAAVIAVLAAILFAYLAMAVARGPAGRFDLAVRDTVHSWASPQLTYAMRGFTLLGSSAILVPLGILLAWRLLVAGRRAAVVLLVVAALGGEAWDQGLKLLFHRERPEAFFGLAPDNYSFPSGHSMASGCFYGALAMIAAERSRSRARRGAIWVGAVALIGCVGLSRIYLGVHYPTDVLGGYLVAVAWLALIAAVTPPGRSGH